MAPLDHSSRENLFVKSTDSNNDMELYIAPDAPLVDDLLEAFHQLLESTTSVITRDRISEEERNDRLLRFHSEFSNLERVVVRLAHFRAYGEIPPTPPHVQPTEEHEPMMQEENTAAPVVVEVTQNADAAAAAAAAPSNRETKDSPKC